MVELVGCLKLSVLEDPHSAVSSHCCNVLIEGINGDTLHILLMAIKCLDLLKLSIQHAPQDSRVINGT